MSTSEALVEAPSAAIAHDDTVTVVMPCLNEAGSVGLCTREALETMASAGIEGEVLVVDNGSTDDSAAVARAAGARVIVEPIAGYGSALRAGIQAARGSIIVMADADWTYDMRRIPELVAPVTNGDADLVVGSRLEAATMQSMPWLHRFVGTPTLTYLMRRAAGGIHLRDGSSGYRAFRREKALELGLRGVKFEFMAEMHVRAGQAGLRYLELPAGYRERIGESKLNTVGDGWSNLRVILLLAPDILLVRPGIVLFALGLLVSILGFISPSGIPIGSLKWQPIFFSGIAMTLGLQSVLFGMLAANQSLLRTSKGGRPFAFVEEGRFAVICMVAGLLGMLVGLAIDGLITGNWFLQQKTGFELQLASLAEVLIIMGGLVLGYAFILRSLAWRVGR